MEHFLILFILNAEVIILIDAALDDLTAAITLYVENVIIFVRFGRGAAEKLSQKSHGMLTLPLHR